MKNGTKTCKNSPTIYEEDLHNAIIDGLKEVLPKSDDIAKKVRDEIEAVIMRPPSKNGHKKASKNEMNRSISLIY